MPGTYPFLVLSPIAGMAVFCAAQIFIARASKRSSPYFSLALGGVFGMLVTIAWSWASAALMRCDAADAWAQLALNTVTYFALAFGYFNFVNMNFTSLRIRMLEELLASGGESPRPHCWPATTPTR